MALEGNAIVNGAGDRATRARAGNMGKRDMSGDLRGVGDPISKTGNSIVSTNADIRQRHAVIRGGRRDEDASRSEQAPTDTAQLSAPSQAQPQAPEQPADSRTAAAEFGRRGTVV